MNRFVRLKSDMTLDSAETERQMERFDVVGVPTILFFDEKGEERLRLEEMVYPDDLLGRLEQAALLDASVFEGCLPAADDRPDQAEPRS
jgi:thiol:disulfide interchange protein